MSKTSSAQNISSVSYSYAQRFIGRRLKTFRKDLDICLTANEKGQHAYMPGLITCVSLLELFSGLYLGRLKDIGLNGILRYVKKFMDSGHYSDERIAILYEMFRHKIAHCTQPYGVFDTHSVKKNHLLCKSPRKRITWKVNATNRHPAIDVIHAPGKLTEDPPQPVDYTHRCVISVYRLKVDIPKSVTGTDGYLGHLKSDKNALENFATCISTFYNI